MAIALAPMEGLVDALMRDLLTRMGGIDWCVTEFVRVSQRALPESSFYKLAPELHQGAKTPAGTPVHVQLLGSEPHCLAENAVRVAHLGAPVIDLNFGCPAKTVNRSRGGAILLKEPELLHQIAVTVRRALPGTVPLTAKMRLGYEHPEESLACVEALSEGGVGLLVVHARTKVEGYKPPAHWEWIARLQEAVSVPIYANGDIWSVADWQRCRAVSGSAHVMLGRGLVARPDLARQILQAQQQKPIEDLGWAGVYPLLVEFWQKIQQKLAPRYAAGCLKQWLAMLAWTYSEARQLFGQIRRISACDAITHCLLQAAPPSAI